MKSSILNKLFTITLRQKFRSHFGSSEQASSALLAAEPTLQSMAGRGPADVAAWSAIGKASFRFDGDEDVDPRIATLVRDQQLAIVDGCFKFPQQAALRLEHLQR
eukprot:1447591-Amphidinium_carterae.1